MPDRDLKHVAHPDAAPNGREARRGVLDPARTRANFLNFKFLNFRGTG
jgi:hypothetical protein